MKQFFRTLSRSYRQSLSNNDSALSYAVLGAFGGMLSGLAVIAFQLAIVNLANLWGAVNGGVFSHLPPLLIFLIPLAGALVLGLFFTAVPREQREVGIVHVISCMHLQYGVLPLRNALMQFIGGSLALATGQSGGREGPGVHLGGAINSLLGQRLGLPNTSLRVLIACGTAGGIAAAFNAPLSGVIFAMEVIVAEYTVAGFIPVILAAITASVLAHQLGGDGILFHVPNVQLVSMLEMPFILLLGICCGAGATCFIQLSKLCTRLNHRPVMLRFALAGLLTGSLGLISPHVLGIGYDAIDRLIAGDFPLAMIAALLVCKTIATSFSCGVGMPIGLIGPNLIIGACIGSLLGAVGQNFYPEYAPQITLYVVIGMAASMGAVLNAPLAAILAVIEFTHSVSLVLPALLAIVAATLTNSGVFKQRSAHQTVLWQLQRQIPDDPVSKLLHNTSITTRMEVSVVKIDVKIDAATAEPLIQFAPTWCLITRENEPLYLLEGKELSQWLRDNAPTGDETRELTDANIRRWTIASVPVQASLRQALDTMRAQTVEAVCVYSRNNDRKRALQGVVTRESIEKFTLAQL